MPSRLDTGGVTWWIQCPVIRVDCTVPRSTTVGREQQNGGLGAGAREMLFLLLQQRKAVGYSWGQRDRGWLFFAAEPEDAVALLIIRRLQI